MDDYYGMGVKAIWVINPWKRIGYYATPRGLQQTPDSTLRVPDTRIEIALQDLFSRINPGT